MCVCTKERDGEMQRKGERERDRMRQREGRGVRCVDFSMKCKMLVKPYNNRDPSEQHT